jgi:phosphate transport system substrate-binding protein
MMRASVLVLICALLGGCAGSIGSGAAGVATAERPTLPTGKITFAGSTTMQPLVEKLAEQYRRDNDGIQMEIAAGGSVVGINAVQAGRVDVGMASRDLKDGEMKAGMQQFPIAYDALAVIVNPKNPVRSLTVVQLRDIYLGKLTSWKELGGPDTRIRAVVREVSSGTRGAFDDLVLGGQAPAVRLSAEVTAGEVETTVAGDPGAIGYVGFGNLRPDIAAVSVDGVAPSPEAVQSGSYKLRRPLILLLGSLSRPLARTFVDFALSPEGQSLVAQDGWVPIRPKTP